MGSSPGLGNGIGLYDPATPITLGGTGQGQSNFYGYNNGPGVLLGPAAAVGSSALGERFAGDSEVGILIGTLTTPTSAPAPFTPSSPLFSPVITESSIQSGLLEISGYALPGSIIGFYASASTDVHGNGEGVLFLGSFVEGSSADTNSTVGTGAMAGANQFNFTFVVPSSITPSMSVTAISAGTADAPVVSQFAADSQTTAGSVGPTISSGGNATVLVGQPFSYQGFFGDNASTTLSGTANYDDGTGNQPLSIKATAVTPPSYDEYTPLATGTYNLSHIFTAPGTYDVTFLISDGDSYTASGGVTVTVLATPPTIDPGQVTLAPTNDPTNTASPTIVTVDESITVSGTFTDPNPGVTSSRRDRHGDNLLGRRQHTHAGHGRPGDSYVHSNACLHGTELGRGGQGTVRGDGDPDRHRGALDHDRRRQALCRGRRRATDGARAWLHLGDSRPRRRSLALGTVSGARGCQRPLRCGRQLGRRHDPNGDQSLRRSHIVLGPDP